MMRHAIDDFDAMLVAQGMEKAGADVFSITYDGHHRLSGGLIDTAKFIVWAKVKNEAELDLVDK